MASVRLAPLRPRFVCSTKIHLLNKTAPEVPFLEPYREAVLLEHPGDPGRPGAISFNEAAEKITLLLLRAVGQRVHSRFHLLKSVPLTGRAQSGGTNIGCTYFSQVRKRLHTPSRNCRY